MAETARLDKWLWAARIYKTRSIAIDACKNGRVTMKGQRVKPSHIVKAGDVIDVRKNSVTFTFRIIQPIEHRVGAKMVPQVLENLTAPEQYELLEMRRISGFVNRAKGTGRPTKRDRRKMEEFTTPVYMDDTAFENDDADGSESPEDDDFDFDFDSDLK